MVFVLTVVIHQSSSSISSSSSTVNVTIVFDESANITNSSKEAIKAIVVGLVGENNMVDVVVELDDAGRVAQVVVVTPDNEAAWNVVSVINDELGKGDQCTAGVLCKATDVFADRKSGDSGGWQLQCCMDVLLVECFVILFVTKHETKA